MQITENIELNYTMESDEQTTTVREFHRAISNNFLVIDAAIADALDRIADSETNIASLDKAIEALEARGIHLCSIDETATLEDGTNVPKIDTPDARIVYLVSSGDAAPNIWLEYIWVNETWEQWGSSKVDLTGYASESYVDTKSSEALTSANGYTDTKATETLTSAKSDATTKANNALNSAKSYVDGYIGDVDAFKKSAVDDFWNGKKSIWFGTSITAYCTKSFSVDGTTYNFVGSGYTDLTTDQLGMYTPVVKGYPGAALAYSRNDSVYGSIYEEIGSTSVANYDLVCIECGTNDFKLDVPLGSWRYATSLSSFDTETFYGALQYSVQSINSKNPNAIIMLITDTHRDNGGYSSTTYNSSTDNGDTADRKLSAYVNAIQSAVTKYKASGVKITCCDWYNESGITMSNLDRYTVDGLHLNDLGYEMVSLTTIDSLLEYAQDNVEVPTLCDIISRLEALEAKI